VPDLAWVGGGAPCPGAGQCSAARALRSSCAALRRREAVRQDRSDL
jgi:hypothetical protein